MCENLNTKVKKKHIVQMYSLLCPQLTSWLDRRLIIIQVIKKISTPSNNDMPMEPDLIHWTPIVVTMHVTLGAMPLLSN